VTIKSQYTEMASRRQPRTSRASGQAGRPQQRPGRAGGPRDRNRHNNVRRLVDASLALFLDRGIAAVTIDDIVRDADMAKGSFYRYVADKTELVSRIIEPVAREITASLDRCELALRAARAEQLASVYVALAAELSTAITRAPTRVLLYLQEARSPAGSARDAIHAFRDHVHDRAAELTRVARDAGLIRDVDPRVSSLVVIGAVEAILVDQLRGRASAEVAALTTELVTTILHGIRIDPVPRRAR
jgi:AcrR family transcriptional regulator